MKNMKHLFAGFVVGVVLAIAPSCGGTKPCNSTTCATGCCDAKGECQAGTSNGACGQLGGTCQICQIAQACSLGTCAQTNGNGGGNNTGGGGTTGGGTGGGTTGGGGGTTGGGGGTTGGGGGTTGGGGGTTGGGGGTCDGCFFQGSCIIRANSNNNTLCGQGGVQCATCSGNQTCQNYVCATGTGGGTGGGGTTGGGGGTTGGGGGTTVAVGTTCTSSPQCSGLGAGAYCKLQTTPFGAATASPYPSGFCTLPCSGPGTCPGSVCAGGQSSYPYLFNEVDRFCTPACTTTANCTTGFQCLPVEPLAAGTTSARGCFLNLQTGGTFTGGGNPTKAGNPCTSDAICANPPDPILAVCQMSADFPNGYCLASSDLAPADTWCDNAGKTEMGFPLPDGGTSYYCLGTCTTPGQVGSSRTGYTCFQKSSTMTTVGVLWPKCTLPADCAGITGMTACNTTTGFCCDTATGTTNCRFSLAP